MCIRVRLTNGDHDSGDVACETRRKGSASWRSMSSKPSLKVKLSQAWRGIKKFTLNNGVHDRTPNGGKWNEILGYAADRQVGLKGPRDNVARVALTVGNGTIQR